MSGALTYPEAGATRGTLPPGYHHLQRTRTVGRSQADFRRAGAKLMDWRLQRAARFEVDASTPTIVPGTRVRLTLGPRSLPRRLRPSFGCEVVYVVEEPHRIGFAYGTLPGHPKSGEERFSVELRRDGTVELTITAFSRPASWWSRLGSPVARLAQRRITERYLDALT